MPSNEDDQILKAVAQLSASPPTPEIQKVELRAMPSPAGTPPEARFGERLRDARQQLGLSVEALSRLTKAYDAPAGKGVSPPTLSRYESNDTLPTLRELRLLAESLDVPAQWLLDGNQPNVKGDAEAQALIQALRKFIQWAQSDISLGGPTISETLQWHRATERAALLADAKRPGTSD